MLLRRVRVTGLPQSAPWGQSAAAFLDLTLFSGQKSESGPGTTGKRNFQF
jgi:hypothetical protein